jgi:hypothetical protein
MSEQPRGRLSLSLSLSLSLLTFSGATCPRSPTADDENDDVDEEDKVYATILVLTESRLMSE